MGEEQKSWEQFTRNIIHQGKRRANLLIATEKGDMKKFGVILHGKINHIFNRFLESLRLDPTPLTKRKLKLLDQKNQLNGQGPSKY